MTRILKARGLRQMAVVLSVVAGLIGLSVTPAAATPPPLSQQQRTDLLQQ